LTPQTAHIAHLLQKLLSEPLSPAEQQELDVWLFAAPENRQLYLELTNETWVRAELEKFNRYDEETAREKIRLAMAGGRVVAMRSWLKWAVAAAIILLAGIGSYLWLKNDKPATEIVQATPAKDLAPPETNRAMITLADGRKIYLDSAGTGTLSTENGTEIVRTSQGEVLYKNDPSQQPSAISHQLSYNTLTNPRGSRVISLTLADGTRVWLNSESSLRYPIAFTGTTREVEITGEAYFEVAPSPFTKGGGRRPGDSGGARRAGDSRAGDFMPFIVTANSVKIEVLGTHFNINSYSSEEAVKTTLVEGSVKLSLTSATNNTSSIILKPGQQGVAQRSSGTHHSSLITHSPDLEEILAWKNGKFQFNDASIQTIMDQVARWYDAEVVYEGKIIGGFVADISRDVPVSKLLRMLELTNRVHFEISGRKIIVKP
jgi:transmembrane sensor